MQRLWGGVAGPSVERAEDGYRPSVRVRVSLGGTSPRLLAMALDILGAVVPCPAPAPSRSPRSAEGVPERALPPLGEGKLPEGKIIYIVLLLPIQCMSYMSAQIHSQILAGWLHGPTKPNAFHRSAS